ncbi:protein phosphatase 2C domain-containing protein [Xylophilus sp. GW821-FHT01B05]
MNTGYRLVGTTGIHKGDRHYQQDQVVLLPHAQSHGCLLGVIADGMGGRSGGRKAADQVILTARQLFERYSPAQDDPAAFLRKLVDEAHLVIRLIATSSEEEPHSTLAAFLISPRGECHWVHVGDSRLYHFRKRLLAFRTVDHSYVQALVDRGEISEAEAESHPKSNILLGCLGMETEPPVGTHTIDRLQPGDVIMACSDGVWHYLRPHEMATALSTSAPREAVQWLIDTARSRSHGSGDNLSMAVIKVEPLDTEA